MNGNAGVVGPGAAIGMTGKVATGLRYVMSVLVWDTAGPKRDDMLSGDYGKFAILLCIHVRRLSFL